MQQNFNSPRPPGVAPAPASQPTGREEAPQSHSPRRPAGSWPGPRESHLSQSATPRACSLASEGFRCHRLAPLPGATSEWLPPAALAFLLTGHSPGSTSYRPNYPCSLPWEGIAYQVSMTGGLYPCSSLALLVLTGMPVPTGDAQAPQGYPFQAPGSCACTTTPHRSTFIPISVPTEHPQKAPQVGVHAAHPFNKCLPA